MAGWNCEKKPPKLFERLEGTECAIDIRRDGEFWKIGVAFQGRVIELKVIGDIERRGA